MLLSVVKPDGRRVKLRVTSRDEADSIVSTLLGKQQVKVPAAPTVQVDDWGVPIARVDDGMAASFRSALGIAPTPPATPPKTEPTEEQKKQTEKQEQRKKNAKSLSGFLGFGWATADVFIGRKLCEWLEKEHVKPSDKMVGDLSDATKDMITEWFGERKIEPWQMVLILSLVIPTSMILQAKPKPKPATPPNVSAQTSAPSPGTGEHLKVV